MAFVEIQKGNDKKVVSHSSFENFFRNAGWKLAGEIPATSQSIENKKKEKKQKEVEEEDAQDEWDEVLNDETEADVDEDIEKPLSEMTKREMVEYAEKNGISLAGLSTAAQYRQAIEEYLKEV